MNDHIAFSLRISSEYQLQGHVPAEFTVPDVVIRAGQVSAPPLRPTHATPFIAATARDCVFDLPGLGRYHAHDGTDIVVEAESETLWMPEFLALPLAACLEQRGLMVLSGAAVATPAGAWLLLGRHGAGVSTLAFALMRQGHALLADMLAVVDGRAGHPQLLAEGGGIRLWDDMAAHFGLPAAPPLRPGVAKRRYPATEAAPTNLPVAGVIVLTRDQIAVPGHRRLAGVEAIRQLVDLRHPPGLARRCSPGMLQSAVALAEAVPVHELRRPRGDSDPAPLGALASRIMGASS